MYIVCSLCIANLEVFSDNNELQKWSSHALVGMSQRIGEFVRTQAHYTTHNPKEETHQSETLLQ